MQYEGKEQISRKSVIASYARKNESPKMNSIQENFSSKQKSQTYKVVYSGHQST